MTPPLFLIPIVVGLTAQFSKRFFNKRWLSQITIRGVQMPRYGGMPSAHTAFAFSLLTTVALADGFSSSTFAITTVMTVLILDDALRMRVFLGRQGEAISRLTAQHTNTKPLKKTLETQLGHKPSEVIVGAIVGVVLSWIIFALIG